MVIIMMLSTYNGYLCGLSKFTAKGWNQALDEKEVNIVYIFIDAFCKRNIFYFYT